MTDAGDSAKLVSELRKQAPAIHCGMISSHTEIGRLMLEAANWIEQHANESFAEAVERAADHLYITTDEANAAIKKHREETHEQNNTRLDAGADKLGTVQSLPASEHLSIEQHATPAEFVWPQWPHMSFVEGCPRCHGDGVVYRDGFDAGSHYSPCECGKYDPPKMKDKPTPQHATPSSATSEAVILCARVGCRRVTGISGGKRLKYCAEHDNSKLSVYAMPEIVEPMTDASPHPIERQAQYCTCTDTTQCNHCRRLDIENTTALHALAAAPAQAAQGNTKDKNKI